MVQGFPLLRLQALHIGGQLADSHTVAEDGNGLVRMLVRNAAHCMFQALSQLTKALTMGSLPGGITDIEAVQFAAVKVAHTAPGLVFPVAQVHFPQIRIGVQFQSLGLINGLGRSTCPVQVAGIHRVNMYIGKPAPERLDLFISIFSDQRVIPAVDTAVEVALCLGMADKIDSRHKGSILWVENQEVCLQKNAHKKGINAGSKKNKTEISGIGRERKGKKIPSQRKAIPMLNCPSLKLQTGR